MIDAIGNQVEEVTAGNGGGIAVDNDPLKDCS
jgi:hypothetical protein